MKPIKIAFLYRKCPSLTSDYFFTNLYNFFFKALTRNSNIEVEYFQCDEIFDASKLKGKFDAIIIPDNQNNTGDVAIPDTILGIENLTIPVFCKPGDLHDSLQFDPFEYHEKYKIDAYFDMAPKEYFHKFYPKEFNFSTVYIGLEPSLYSNLIPFEKRIKDKIINSGNVGNPNPASRLLKKIQNKGPTNYDFYKLRTWCNKLKFVDYTSTLDHDFVGDRYPLLLQQYRAAISASSITPTRKYLEIPPAGCLTFMEITEKNQGSYLGYKNLEHVVFIDEKNYENKFAEFLNDPDNSKWQEIASNGAEYAMSNLSNDNGVKILVDLIKEYL